MSVHASEISSIIKDKIANADVEVLSLIHISEPTRH